MGRNDRLKNGLELVLILPLIYAVSAAPTCREDQKLRQDEDGLRICCYTARCNTSQRFEFCKQDQGHDICVNCSPDSYTNDKINTAQWDEEINFCIPKPLCNSDELISVGNSCECNLAKGYWGVDSSNCQLDIYNCKQAGQQLRQKDGECINCEEDKFKPEDGTYGICRDKTKCKAGEEEVDPGSIKRDRRCLAIQIVPTSTLAPPTITTNTEPPNEEKKNDDGASILYWLLPLVSIVLIFVMVCLCWKYQIYTRGPFGNLCCQRLDTRNRSEDEEFLPLQNGQKHIDCNSNGSVKREKQHFHDSSLTNRHATGTDEADNSQTLDKSVLDSEQPLLNGHATGTGDSVNAETIVKSIVDNDDKYPSLGESIFDNDKNPSLEQNEGSHIGTQMSAASNSETPVVKTSPGNANNTGVNSVYDTARTGSTGNIPNSEIFHSLNTTASNTTQHHDIGEGPKSKEVNRRTGNTEAHTSIIRPMATASRVTGNTEPLTNNTRPTATVNPIPRSGTSTSSRSQEANAPDNHDERFPASPTTTGGIDVRTAVTEENSKFVFNATYPFEQPSHVNLDRNLPPDESSESLDDYVAVGGSSRNDDSIVTETGSEPTQENMDGGNRSLPPEETSESLDDYVTVGGVSRNVIERTSAGENGSGLHTVHGNLLVPPESTSTTSSNEPSLP